MHTYDRRLIHSVYAKLAMKLPVLAWTTSEVRLVVPSLTEPEAKEVLTIVWALAIARED